MTEKIEVVISIFSIGIYINGGYGELSVMND